MTELEICLSFALVATTGYAYVHWHLSEIQRDLLEMYKKDVEVMRERLNHEASRNLLFNRYCLVDIHNKAILKEDYETAQQCMEYIKRIDEVAEG